jgi:spore germination protein GerM
MPDADVEGKTICCYKLDTTHKIGLQTERSICLSLKITATPLDERTDGLEGHQVGVHPVAMLNRSGGNNSLQASIRCRLTGCPLRLDQSIVRRCVNFDIDHASNRVARALARMLSQPKRLVEGWFMVQPRQTKLLGIPEMYVGIDNLSLSHDTPLPAPSIRR